MTFNQPLSPPSPSPFVATPLFQTAPTYPPKTNQYQRIVIDRIVTPIPYRSTYDTTTSVEGTYDEYDDTEGDTNHHDWYHSDPGEIEVCMEDWYPKPEPPSPYDHHNHPHDNEEGEGEGNKGSNHDTIPHYQQHPLFRRIAIRSHSGGIDHDDHDDGILHASFELPVPTRTTVDRGDSDATDRDRNGSESRPERTNDGAGISSSVSVTEAQTPQRRNWMCWAVLEQSSSSSVVSTTANTANTSSTASTASSSKPHGHESQPPLQPQPSRTRSKPNKPYLCVLVGPNTLRIFDVFPNPYQPPSSTSTTTTNNNNTNTRATSVGEGHAITLPFQASSIFSLPSSSSSSTSTGGGGGGGGGTGGLLIQRAVGTEDVTLRKQEEVRLETEVRKWDLPTLPFRMGGGGVGGVGSGGEERGEGGGTFGGTEYYPEDGTRRGCFGHGHYEQEDEDKGKDDITTVEAENINPNDNKTRDPTIVVAEAKRETSHHRNNHHHHPCTRLPLPPSPQLLKPRPRGSSESLLFGDVRNGGRSSSGVLCSSSSEPPHDPTLLMLDGYDAYGSDQCGTEPLPPPPPPPPYMGSSSNGSSMRIPSLYTLRHPLDEIRPCRILPVCRRSGTDGNAAAVVLAGTTTTATNHPNDNYRVRDRDTVPFTLPTEHFADAYESVIYVGKPRSFHHNHRCYPHKTNDDNDDDGAAVVVTYNVRYHRHAVWVLKNAPPPPPTLPLWKQTTVASKRNRRMADRRRRQREEEEGGKRGPEREEERGVAGDVMQEDGVYYDEEGVREEKEEYEEYEDEDGDRTAVAISSTFPFADLHAHVSLTCIYSTTDTSLVRRTLEPEDDIRDDGIIDPPKHRRSGGPQRADRAGAVRERMAHEVFLSTTLDGSGDFVLCLLHRRFGDPSACPVVLRCLTLVPPSVSGMFWSVSDLVDMPCLAAQPILSTPIDPPSFSLFDRVKRGGGEIPSGDNEDEDDDAPMEAETSRVLGNGSYWQDRRRASNPPMAIDILLLCPSRNNESSSCDDRDDTATRTTLRLFRADAHVMDCRLPLPSFGKDSLGNSDDDEIPTVIDLRNSVGNRVDFVCRHQHRCGSQRNNKGDTTTTMARSETVDLKRLTTSIVRGTISLVMNASPITERALIAIGSALSWSERNVTDQGDDGKGNTGGCRWRRVLSFRIRADCARYAQAISTDKRVQVKADDVEWSAFSALIKSFFRVVCSSFSLASKSWIEALEVSVGLNGEASRCREDSDYAGCMEESMCYEEEGVTDDDDNDDDAAWESLVNSDFHTGYQKGHEDKLFLGAQLEGNDDAGTVTVGTRGAKHMETNINIDYEAHLAKLLMGLSPSSVRWLWESLSSSLSVQNNTKRDTNAGVSCCQRIFDAIHLLYEDVKLTMTSRETDWIPRMGALLFDVCTLEYENGPVPNNQNGVDRMAMEDFIEYYRRDLGTNLRANCVEEEGKQEQDNIVFNIDDDNDDNNDSNMRFHKRMTLFQSPPCFRSVIESMMLERNWKEVKSQISFPLNGVCTAMRTVFRLFFIMNYRNDRYSQINVKGSTDETSFSSLHRRRATDREMVMVMVQEGITNATDLSCSFIPGLTVPLFEILHRCRSDPPPPFSIEYRNWPLAAYRLIGRTDLGLIQRSIPPFPNHHHVDDASHNDIKIPPTQTLSPAQILAHNPVIVSHSLPTTDPQNDGLNCLPHHSCMLFPHDTRVREAARLLRSSLPTFLRITRPIELSDHDYERKKQEALSLRSRRTLSLPVGRGMLTVGTMGETRSMMDVEAEPLQVPALCLSGRVPPQDATLAFDWSGCGFVGDWMVWPEFHNGVAAGLRLPCAKSRGGDNGPLSELARTWIVYNKPANSSSSNPNESGANDPHNNNNGGPQGTNPNNTNNGPQRTNPNNGSSNTYPQQPNHSHGGFLFALGLRGHLSSLHMTDICDYLTTGPVTTTVGVLLGMAAAKLGTCDLSVSKMLCLHIPSLLPPSFASIDVACTTQTAAVAGIGLLYRGSSHRLMTEFFLNEIGKRPNSPSGGEGRMDGFVEGREGYSLCCGIALGMVCLSQKRRKKGLQRSGFYYREGSAGLADLNIEGRLNRYIIGGVDSTVLKRHGDDSERPAEGNNITLGGDVERCSKIYEGENINVDITAPGATLALGMIYLRTGNKAIASQLALPSTHFLLDYVRPDFLFLRVVARTLVLWDDVEPTERWIQDQIPSIVARSYAQLKELAEKTSGLAGLATFAKMSVREQEGVVERNSDDDDIEDFVMDEGESDNTRPSSSPSNNGATIPKTKEEPKLTASTTLDRQAIRQAYVYIISGACFALGLRYAGTSNPQAHAIIHDRVLELQKLRDNNDQVQPRNDPISLALRPEQPIVEMCLGSTAIALAMLHAGTGHLPTLRLLKSLRWKGDSTVRYGNHMAYGCAIGLLFLGGGSCTLGREPEDVASLLMAFFPRFPAETGDNQYHLQALRHLWALAMRNRKIEAIDIDTREKVFMPMQVHYHDRSPINMDTPCLLLDKGQISKLVITSERYYPLEVSLEPYLNSDSNISLYVKKKSGHLSHMQDPHSLRPPHLLQSCNGGGSSEGAMMTTFEAVRRFVSDNTTEDSNDYHLQAFAEYLCITPAQESILQSTVDTIERQPENGTKIVTKSTITTKTVTTTMEEFCTEVLYECLTKEKLDAIPLYLTLFDAVSTMERKSWPIGVIWDLRLLRSFYETTTTFSKDACHRRLRQQNVNVHKEEDSCGDESEEASFELLSRKFIATLCESVDRLFMRFGLDSSRVSSSYAATIASGESVNLSEWMTQNITTFGNVDCGGGENETAGRWLGPFLVWCRVKPLYLPHLSSS